MSDILRDVYILIWMFSSFDEEKLTFVLIVNDHFDDGAQL
jgi:hypothetical protein